MIASTDSISQSPEKSQEKLSDQDSDGNTAPTENPDIRYSDRYSYESLVSKPDMKITTVDMSRVLNRADTVFEAKKNAAKIGTRHKDGSVSVRVEDIDKDVILSKKGLVHGFDRRIKVLSPITLEIGDILSNSILINELIPKKSNVDRTYVLIGVAKDNNNLYIVESVVNSYTNELKSMDVLYSINSKEKSTAVLNAPSVSTPNYRTTISISQLLDYVNEKIPDILPEDVLKHYGHIERPDGELGKSALYSERNPDFVKEREAVERQLERENKKLEEDNEALRELLKIQRTVTHGKVLKKSAIEIAAKKLARDFGAKITHRSLLVMRYNCKRIILNFY